MDEMAEGGGIQSSKRLIGWRSMVFAAFVGILAVPAVFALVYRERLLRPEAVRSCACFLSYIRHGPVIIDAPALWVRYRLTPYVPEPKCTVSSPFDIAVPREDTQVISGNLCTWRNAVASSAMIWFISACGSMFALMVGNLYRAAKKRR